MKARSLFVALAVIVALPLHAQAPQPLRVFIRAGEKTHNPVSDGLHDYPAFLADWAKLLMDRGATDLYVLATHGILSGPAVERLLRLPSGWSSTASSRLTSGYAGW